MAPHERPSHSNVIKLHHKETAEGGRAAKYVFVGRDERDKLATYETGSFFDGGGVGEEKHDICVSSMGGCTRTCTFCAVPTADLGYERKLTSQEIAHQIEAVARDRNPYVDVPNVIGLMGNGEPADNARAVVQGLAQVVNDGRVPISRVTISTIGENDRGLAQFAGAFTDFPVPVRLQLSLHAADDVKRRELIPGRRAIADIMKCVDRYSEITGYATKINVVLMQHLASGFSNATEDDARRLAELLQSPSFYSGKHLRRRLKLSAFNPIPGILYEAPDEQVRQRFVGVLLDSGISQIKTFKGSGIEIKDGKGGFACGQLRATTTTPVAHPTVRHNR